VGSVFSPYYALARGKKGIADPENFCSLNVALYGGSGKRWTMTERGRDSIERTSNQFTIGPSSLTWDGNCLTINVDEINVPLLSRVRGKVRVYPQNLFNFVTPLDDDNHHRWGPLAPSARVEVEFDQPGTKWTGNAYWDSNEGDEPIEKPFVEWDWSRSKMRDGSTAVIYDVRQKQRADHLIALRFTKSGAVETFEAPPRQELPRTFWRVNRHMRSDENEQVRVQETLEDAPFYARSMLSSGLLGEKVISMHETLNVPRLTSLIVRMMLPFRMPRRK
jgi:carotenoid 1,2-hydratase